MSAEDADLIDYEEEEEQETKEQETKNVKKWVTVWRGKSSRLLKNYLMGFFIIPGDTMLACIHPISVILFWNPSCFVQLLIVALSTQVKVSFLIPKSSAMTWKTSRSATGTSCPAMLWVDRPCLNSIPTFCCLSSLIFREIAVQHECIPQAVLGMDIICQAKSGMGKTAVFVLATLHQLQPVEGEVHVLVLCHTRELAFQIQREYERFSKYLPDIKSRVFYGGKISISIPYVTFISGEGNVEKELERSVEKLRTSFMLVITLVHLRQWFWIFCVCGSRYQLRTTTHSSSLLFILSVESHLLISFIWSLNSSTLLQILLVNTYSVP